MKEEKNLIGFAESATGNELFHSYNPATSADNPFLFHKATDQEVNNAAAKAAEAFPVYSAKSGHEKAAFLEAIAEGLIASGDVLVETCVSETGLPGARIEGERGRTVMQLRMFASLLKEGSWTDVRIDTALPDRTPLPRPDLRSMQVALGPVAVFGASNFPLAFSVAGGDTASALAAGCPVIVKAHSAHPATSAIVGKIITEAARKTGMPDGVFSLLFGDGHITGTQLVRHPLVKAVGFTGSYKAGKSIFDNAAARPEPIPVYAEMGSSNPVFILPGAVEQQGNKIAAAYAGSVTLGTGQFCTNPGMLFFPDDNKSDFRKLLEAEFGKTSEGTMLAPSIAASYRQGVAAHLEVPGVHVLAKGNGIGAGNAGIPVLLITDASTFQTHASLSEEIFGPASLVVPTASKEQLLGFARGLSGHLTATIHGTDGDLAEYRELIDILRHKVGRIVINGFPTGVEVCSAMVHGGPFPSTSDGRSTSVGTAAIHRFTRPVCFQNMPGSLLPEELKNSNPLGISRLVNNERTTAAIK
ncbi:MAG: aldehyde dehydrogenase (NADP(+)) [Chitinophagaceae bacterium]|nr:MAG: aldehyde dehydrogenase (NADP(+)) [Chitinophagaceae bacterium]